MKHIFNDGLIQSTLILMLSVVILSFALSGRADAACRIVWVDHDFNVSTPAIQKQVCDSVTDIPAIPSHTVRPVQVPQVTPIPFVGVPAIGTQHCRKQSVYENGKWVTKSICT